MNTALRSLSIVALLAGVVACKSTPEEAPSDGAVITRDVQSDAQPDAPADAQPDAPADAQPDAPADAQPDAPADAQPDAPADASTDALADAPADGPNDASADGPSDAPADAAPADAGCVADGGDGACFACPTTSAEIFNRCTGSACVRFDNRARLPRLLPDGGLPPLP